MKTLIPAQVHRSIMPLETGQKLSHYRLLERIGEGGMGVVWKAEDTVLGRTVAIKVLPADASRDADRRAAFLEEAKLASSVSDAHIIEVYDFGHEGDLDFIVMAYVEGRPLDKLLHGRPLPPDKVVGVGLQIARGLSRAHKTGLVHRDLKPQNVLVTPDGDVKIVDFGLAVLFERSTDSSEATTRVAGSQANTEDVAEPSADPRPIVGTLPYMSPEQVRGDRVDGRSDIFSLAVMLYEMTTGRRPFAGGTRSELLREILQGRPVPVHDLVGKVPVELDRIIQKALAPRKSDRYQTVDDMAVDLQRLARELESGESVSYEDVRTAHRPHARRRMALGLVAVATVVTSLAAVWWFGIRRPAVDPNTIIVLPFEVRGQGEGAEYVGQAFAEGIAINLAQVDGIRVRPVPDTQEAGQTPESGLNFGRRTGAGRVVRGTFTREGDTFAYRVSLLDAKKNEIIWGVEQRSPDGEMSVATGLISRNLITELDLFRPQQYYWFGESVGQAVMDHPVTPRLLRSLRGAWFETAVSLTDELVRDMPGSFDGHALRLQALDRSVVEHEQLGLRGELLSEVAILDSLDSNNPYGEMVRASLLLVDGRNEEAKEECSEVLERPDLSPGARAWLLRTRCESKSRMGDPSALDDIRAAQAFNPADAHTLRAYGGVLRKLKQVDEAVFILRQAVALAPGDPYVHFALGLALSDQEAYSEAANAFGKAYEMIGTTQYAAMYATALWRNGEQSKALTVAGECEKHPSGKFGEYNLACFYAVANQPANAKDHLRKAAALGYRGEWVRQDPDLKSLHGDPEFETIVEAIREDEQ